MPDGGISNPAAKLDENDLDRNIWKTMEPLLSSRRGQRSIVLHNKIVHIGGYAGGYGK